MAELSRPGLRCFPAFQFWGKCEDTTRLCAGYEESQGWVGFTFHHLSSVFEYFDGQMLKDSGERMTVDSMTSTCLPYFLSIAKEKADKIPRQYSPLHQ
jgi:hypothetical protein